MNIEEITDHLQLEGYYKEKGLSTLEERINHLKQEMGIRAMICDDEESIDEVLSGIEESLVQGFWKASKGKGNYNWRDFHPHYKNAWGGEIKEGIDWKKVDENKAYEFFCKKCKSTIVALGKFIRLKERLECSQCLNRSSL